MLLPLQGFYDMFHIFAEIFHRRSNGIGIRRSIEIQGAAQEMMRAVGDIKLYGAGCVAAHIIQDAAHMRIFSLHIRFVDVVGLHGMFEREFITVFDQFIQRIACTDGRVAQIDFALVFWKDDVEPAGMLVQLLGIGGILLNLSIIRILKRKRAGRIVVGDEITLLWKINPEIAVALWSIVFLTRSCQQCNDKAM